LPPTLASGWSITRSMAALIFRLMLYWNHTPSSGSSCVGQFFHFPYGV
jgi:hypothetical protein